MEQWGRCTTVSREPATSWRRQPLLLSPATAFRIPKQQQRQRRLAVKALTAPALSTLVFGQSVPLWVPALLALWPVTQVTKAVQQWTRGFRMCCELPGTLESKSPWRSLGGDLKHGLSPQIHREFTALAEQYGGVYHSRVLWAQACD